MSPGAHSSCGALTVTVNRPCLAAPQSRVRALGAAWQGCVAGVRRGPADRQ